MGCKALKGLGVMGKKHYRARAKISSPALIPAWGGAIPTCLLCLMGRPSHNLGAMLELGTSSGLCHRNWVMEGG